MKFNFAVTKQDWLATQLCVFTCLALPCRMQRCTNRYCPAEFWKTTLLDGRPVIKLLSVSLLLLPASPLSLAESSRLESDSEPEILDTSPTNNQHEKMYMESVQQFILVKEMSSCMCRNTYQLQSSSQTHQLRPEQLLTSSVLDWSGANQVCSVPSDKFNKKKTSLRNGLDKKKRKKEKRTFPLD